MPRIVITASEKPVPCEDRMWSGIDSIADLCADVQNEMDRGPSPDLDAARARLQAALDARKAAGNPVAFDLGPAVPPDAALALPVGEQPIQADEPESLFTPSPLSPFWGE